MGHLENRNKIIDRIEKELIGPGSDVFLCDADFSNEIIEGKPLQRYFSAILFPKQLIPADIDTGKEEFSTNDVGEDSPEKNEITPIENAENEKGENDEDPDDDEPDTVPKSNSNAFYPSHFGFSFCVSKECNEITLTISFGNYKKAKIEEINLPYSGIDSFLIEKLGFDTFVVFDEENKTLNLSHEFKRREKKEDGKLQDTEEYIQLKNCLDHLGKEYSYSHPLYKHISKLFFKDKYKRFKNEIPVPIKIVDLVNKGSKHLEIVLSKIPGVNSENWHKDNKDNLVLHLKLYNAKSDKYFIKAVFENKYGHNKNEFSLSKEKLNQLALFQSEIKVISRHLQPFKDYHPNLYKTGEDRMLDYLFRDKLGYGIGHNTSCTWENCEQDDQKPNWIKTTFLPAYNVKSQSTETDKIANEILNIKNLSCILWRC